MTSVRRELTVRPLKPVLERASGMRIFEGDEIVTALEGRGFTGIHRRLSGMVQFVGAASPSTADFHLNHARGGRLKLGARACRAGQGR